MLDYIKREEITDFTQMMDHTIQQIGLTLRANNNWNTEVGLLKWHLRLNGSLLVAPRGRCPIHLINDTDSSQIRCPAWQGRVWILFSADITHYQSNILHSTILHAGRGGVGLHGLQLPNSYVKHTQSPLVFTHRGKQVYPYSWDATIFVDDVPGMKLAALLNESKVPHNDTRIYEQTDNQSSVFSGSD